MDRKPACQAPGIDPDLWDTARPKADQLKAAEYCQGCPQLAWCTAEAMQWRPRGLIQAGLRWDMRGTPHPIAA